MREQGCSWAMEETILSQGKQCFRHSHYLCHTKDGDCLPWDPCPFEAIVTNLSLKKVKKRGNCARVSGTYDVMVWFRYAKGQMVGQSETKGIEFLVHIPLKTIGDSNLPGFKSRLCAQSISLGVVKAVVEKQRKSNCSSCGKRIKIVLEQEIMAFEYALEPLCLPSSRSLKEGIIALGSEKECQSSSIPPSQEPRVVPEKLLPTAPAVIKGKVTGKEGHPLFRAKVKVSAGNKEYFTRTNIDGNYFLTLYPDDYKVVITKNGYIAQVLQIKLDSGQISRKDLQLEKNPGRKGLRLKF